MCSSLPFFLLYPSNIFSFLSSYKGKIERKKGRGKKKRMGESKKKEKRKEGKDGKRRKKEIKGKKVRLCVT